MGDNSLCSPRLINSICNVNNLYAFESNLDFSLTVCLAELSKIGVHSVHTFTELYCVFRRRSGQAFSSLLGYLRIASYTVLLKLTHFPAHDYLQIQRKQLAALSSTYHSRARPTDNDMMELTSAHPTTFISTFTLHNNTSPSLLIDLIVVSLLSTSVWFGVSWLSLAEGGT